MKVTINFSESAYQSEVISNGKSIKPSVTVEFTDEQVASFTKEQRELLIEYTKPKKGTNRFDEEFVLVNPWDGDSVVMYDQYTDDVFRVIDDCEGKVKKNRSDALAKVIEYNCNLKKTYEQRVRIAYLQWRWGRGFSPYLSPGSFEADQIIVSLYDAETSCEDMVANLERWSTDNNVGVTPGTIIQQLQELCAKAYEEKEAERKRSAELRAAEEQRRKDAEAKKQKQMAFMEEWVMRHGSQRLKALMDNAFEYKDEFRKEYAVFTYGTDVHLGDEKYDDHNDFDDITSSVECPTDEHLELFLSFKSKHPGVVLTFLEYQSKVSSYDELLEDADYDECSSVFVRVIDENVGNIYVEL